MKSIDSIRHASLRETLAWLVLTAAVVLLAAAFAMAQDNAEKTSGQIHIRMEKNDNGKVTRIDTTFDAADMEQAREFMDRMNGDENTPEPPSAPGNAHQYRYHFKGMPLDESDAKEFRADMKRLKEEMKGLSKKLKEMHVEMYSDSGWTIPPIPPMPPSWDADDWKDWEKDFEHNWNGHCLRVYADSADADARVIILDRDDEAEIEKAIRDADGAKVIIIQRSDKKDGKQHGTERKAKAEKSSSKHALDATLEAYPNPNQGRFTVSFRLQRKGDASVQVIDPAGKVVYTETLKDFSGEYKKEIELPGKSRGTYLVKISQGNQSLSRKLVIE